MVYIKESYSYIRNDQINFDEFTKNLTFHECFLCWLFNGAVQYYLAVIYFLYLVIVIPVDPSMTEH